MLNQFTLVGRLTKNPQLFCTKEGISYAYFTLAIRRVFKNSKGQYDTDFIQCVSWNKTATHITDYCSKGSLISVSGRIQMRTIEVETKNYSTMQIPELVVDQVSFISLKKSSEQKNGIEIPLPPIPDDSMSDQQTPTIPTFEHPLDIDKNLADSLPFEMNSTVRE